MRAYGITHQGLIRANNEDSFYIDEDNGLLIVADGMGGHAGGEEASRLAVETVVQTLPAGFARQPEQAINEAILSANRVVFSKADTDPALAGMGTTLTLLAVGQSFIYTGHIGDSRAFLIGSSGIQCLTGDHSVSGQLLATGKITDAEAVHHPQRHILTRALGTGLEIDVEILSFPWSTGQQVLLCSDGLTEVVTSQEIFAQVSGSGPLEKKVDALLKLVLERGAPDNVTIILAEL